MREPKWLYQYDGVVQRIQIKCDAGIEDGSKVVNIHPHMRFHLDTDDSLIAVEIRDQFEEWDD